MQREHILHTLSTQEPAVLIDLLTAAYDCMTHDQRQTVFGRYAATLPPAAVDGEQLLEEIRSFHGKSYAKAYYAPFPVNSKNYMDIPEATNRWFEELGDFLKASDRLTEQGDHPRAVVCFALLYELIESIEYGDEIVFADELGSWMIPVNEQEFQDAYLASLAAATTDEEFTETTVYLIRRDGRNSFAHHAYAGAVRVATPAQRAQLDAVIDRENIPVKRTQ